MSIRISASSLFIAIGIVVTSAACTRTQERPNIVVIVADDLGYADLGCYGSPDIRTPNIDALAEGGVKFTGFYANAPECTPTRAAFLTGKYQQRVGGLECAIGTGNVGRYDDAIRLSQRNELGLPAEGSILMQSMKDAGYRTALLGKWHLGYEREFRPDRHGFDYSFCLLGGMAGYFYHTEQVDHGLDDFTSSHTLAENGKEVFADGEYLTELITQKAIEWLKGLDRDEHFFLFLPYTAPHLPYQGPGDDTGMPVWESGDAGSREKYAEMVEALDSSVGEIMRYINNRYPAGEILVIFFSDNGGTTFADNGIYRSGKGTVFEGGIHVPCIIQWSWRIPANTISEQTCISFDLTRSLIELAGPDRGIALDGYDILNHVLEGREDITRTLFWRAKRGERVQKAVRDGDHKYLIRYNADEILHEGLFDLKADPSEKENQLDISPGLANELKKKLVAWEEEVSVTARR